MMHAHEVRTCMDATEAPDTRRKILILEQDEYLASLMHLLLYREGFAITAITDPTQIQHHLAAHYPAKMLFISHRWLRDDNPEVLHAIRQHTQWHDVPIIMLLNYYDLDLIERVNEQGVSDYLLQPIEPAVLLDTVNKFLKPVN